MAKRRMFSEKIIESDEFYALSSGAQVLYFHLNLVADDDGLVGSVMRTMRSIKATKRHLSELAESGYVILFDSGVVAITHWLAHNKIRKDRYESTRYKSEFSRLGVRSNETYFLEDLSAKMPQNDGENAAQVSLGEGRLGKESLGKVSTLIKDAREGDVENSESVEKSDGGTKNAVIIKHFTDTLTPEEKIEYSRFLNKVNLYFMSEYGIIKTQRFIDYNEARFWRGKNGESVMENYKRYIREWMAKEG